MENKHSLIRRQLRKTGLDSMAPEGPLFDFIKQVDDSYVQFDGYRELLERSLDLSSRELLDANANLLRILHSLPHLFLRIGDDDRIRAVYESDTELATPATELVGTSVQDLGEVVGVEAAAMFRRAIEQVRNGSQPDRFEYCVTATGGSRRWYDVQVLPIEDGEVLCAVLNVSERKETEERLIRAQRLEAVGQLAAGVAHDFNNLLTVVNGYTDMLMAECSDEDHRHPMLAAIRDAGERAALLTAQLLAFGGRQMRETREVDLNEVIGGIIDLLQRGMRSDLELRMNLSPETPAIEGDPGQLEQVVVNLVINARDAMPDGGVVRIETRRGNLDDRRAAVLTISDTGVGMTDDVKQRVFDPFFTTKSEGKGTGLGLASVYGIVTQMSGSLDVESVPGGGTTFEVRLPASS